VLLLELIVTFASNKAHVKRPMHQLNMHKDATNVIPWRR